jgi:hypothetical protein
MEADGGRRNPIWILALSSEFVQPCESLFNHPFTLLCARDHPAWHILQVLSSLTFSCIGILTVNMSRSILIAGANDGPYFSPFLFKSISLFCRLIVLCVGRLDGRGDLLKLVSSDFAEHEAVG